MSSNKVDEAEVRLSAGAGLKQSVERNIGTPTAVVGTKSDTNACGNECKSPNTTKTASYANKLNNIVDASVNKLYQIPTMLNEEGHEYVIFYEGSKKWELTACGFMLDIRCPCLN